MNTTIKKLKQKLKLEEEKLQKQQLVIEQLNQKLEEEYSKHLNLLMKNHHLTTEQLIEFIHQKTQQKENEINQNVNRSD